MKQAKKKINTRDDIQLLVDTFYGKVLKDEVIGYFFTEVVAINWEEHMPLMYDFWESVLLDNPAYRGNPIAKHMALDEKSRLEPEHFDHWIQLFHATVDELFEGEKADQAKFRVEHIKNLMLHKIRKNRADHQVL